MQRYSSKGNSETTPSMCGLNRIDDEREICQKKVFLLGKGIVIIDTYYLKTLNLIL